MYIETGLSCILSGMENVLCDDQLSMLKKNYHILQRLTNIVVELNCEFFNEKLKDRLRENYNFLHMLSSSNDPLVDSWGRCTYFFSKIGPYTLLIYQPGTPTFLSSVKKDCDLVATHDNCQQNGAILGMSCGCFLAEFVTYLCRLYQDHCSKLQIDSSNFHPKVYTTALETCLKKFVDEDREAHGRLIEMKDLLLTFGGSDEVKYESLWPYFYSKDVNHKYGDQNWSEMNLSQISSKDYSSILRRRAQYSTYQHLENYFESATSDDEQHFSFINSEIWKIIRENILIKNGIFKDPTLTRRWLAITFDGFEKRFMSVAAATITTEATISDKQTTIEIRQLEHNYDLSKNEKLMEYFTQIQRGLESLFRSAVIADADVFEIRTPDLRRTFEAMGDLVPEIKTILFCLSQTLQVMDQRTLEAKLRDLCNLSIRCPVLPEFLARKVTIMKRNYIMSLKECDAIGLCSKLDTMMRTNNYTKNMSVQRKLAIHDTKILEVCCIRLLCKGDINPLTDDVQVIVEKIAIDFKKVQSYAQISNELTSTDEQPTYFKRREPFSIPNVFFDHHANHRFMKQMANNEDPDEHRGRVKEYLKELTSDKIQDLLGSIDPSDQELTPLFILLMEVKKEKKKSCVMS